MTREQALEKLELEDGATQNEIQQQFNEFYNEFQIRITNAPTEHQRKLYQKKLIELEEAFSIFQEATTEATGDLPGMEINESETSEPVTLRQNAGTMDIKKALNVFKLSSTATRAEILKEYQQNRLELARLINARSGGIAEVAKEELESIEKAIKVLVDDVTEKEFYPEKFGGAKQSKKTKVNVNIIIGVVASLVALFLLYLFVFSNAFETDYQKEILRGRQILETGNWREAEPIFKGLIGTPVEDDAQIWLSTVEELKSRELADYKEKFFKFKEKGRLIEAESYYEKIDKITPMNEFDKTIFIDWLDAKDELATMKGSYNRSLNDAERLMESAEFDQAEAALLKALTYNPSSTDVKSMKGEIEKMRKAYADCFSRLEEADAYLMLYSPKEKEYKIGVQIYRDVVKNCPNIQAAQVRLKEIDKK
jgi:tetratricopeptide (TPR) repeat protein